MKPTNKNLRLFILCGCAILSMSLGCSLGKQTIDSGKNTEVGDLPPVSTANQGQPTTAPDDLMELIFWGGWGGGGAESGGDACVDGYPHMWIDAHIPGDLTPGSPLHWDNPESPYYYSTAEDGVIGMEFWIGGCNFLPGDYIDLQLTLPDNTLESYPRLADDNGSFNLYWVSVPGDQFGVYSVYTSTLYGEYLEFFTIDSFAPAPFIRGFCNSSLGANAVMLAGFQPNEQVLMARYESSQELTDRLFNENPEAYFNAAAELAEHWYISVDSNGTAITWANGIQDVIVAIGTESPGYTQYSQLDNSSMNVTAMWYSDCDYLPAEFLPVHP